MWSLALVWDTWQVSDTCIVSETFTIKSVNVPLNYQTSLHQHDIGTNIKQQKKSQIQQTINHKKND